MDSECETSQVFATFLAIDRDGEFGGDFYKGYHFAEYPIRPGDAHVFTFLDKWECTGIKATLINELCLRAKEPNSHFCPMDLFVVGAKSNQRGLCVELLWHFPKRKWPKRAEGVPSGLPGRIIWDPKSWPWPFWIYQHCPAPYIFALIRAWEDSQTGDYPLSYYFDVALPPLLEDQTLFGGRHPSPNPDDA